MDLKCCVGYCCVDRIMKLGMLQEMLHCKIRENAKSFNHRLGPL